MVGRCAIGKSRRGGALEASDRHARIVASTASAPIGLRPAKHRIDVARIRLQVRAASASANRASASGSSSELTRCEQILRGLPIKAGSFEFLRDPVAASRTHHTARVVIGQRIVVQTRADLHGQRRELAVGGIARILQRVRAPGIENRREIYFCAQTPNSLAPPLS